MNDDEDEGPKPNHANLEDDFLRHPHSGAYVRNPFVQSRSKSTPILFQASEYNHNCLDDALAEWQCVTVSESAFRKMTQPRPAGSMADEPPMISEAHLVPAVGSGMHPSSPLQRAALHRLQDLPEGFEFIVSTKKSSYVQARQTRRRPMEPKIAGGIVIDKMNIEVSWDGNLQAFRIDNMYEGLVTSWNRTHPAFLHVKVNDSIVKVNERSKNSQKMLEELVDGPDNVRLTLRRPPPTAQRGSITDGGPRRASLGGGGGDAEATMVPGQAHQKRGSVNA